MFFLLRYYNSRFDNAENIGLKFELVSMDGQTYLSTNKDKAEVICLLFIVSDETKLAVTLS